MYELSVVLANNDANEYPTIDSVTPKGQTVTDASLGRLHAAGIAQEFHMTGRATLTVEWKKGQRYSEGGKHLLDAPGTSGSR